MTYKRPISYTGVSALTAVILTMTSVSCVAIPAQAHAQVGPVVDLASERAVNPGESIQAAINAARPGDTITIRPGVYHEQLLITKRGLTLRGTGVRIEPPLAATPKACDASNKPAPVASGICVAGTFKADGSVAEAVENVTITGIWVNGFPGAGISAEAAHNFTLRAVETSNNGYVGVFVRFSSHVTVEASVSNNNGDSGYLFIGGSDDNVIASVAQRNQGEGVLYLETEGGSVRASTFIGNCTGVSIVNLDVLPTDTSGIGVRDNVISQNNRLCPRNQSGQGNPQFESIGVLVAGSRKIDVRNNTITGHSPKDPVDLPPGGVVVIDTTAQGGAKPADVTVAGNVLRNNTPADLFSDGTGANIVFSHNTCKASQPAGAC